MLYKRERFENKGPPTPLLSPCHHGLIFLVLCSFSKIHDLFQQLCPFGDMHCLYELTYMCIYLKCRSTVFTVQEVLLCSVPFLFRWKWYRAAMRIQYEILKTEDKWPIHDYCLQTLYFPTLIASKQCAL